MRGVRPGQLRDRVRRRRQSGYRAGADPFPQRRSQGGWHPDSAPTSLPPGRGRRPGRGRSSQGRRWPPSRQRRQARRGRRRRRRRSGTDRLDRSGHGAVPSALHPAGLPRAARSERRPSGGTEGSGGGPVQPGGPAGGTATDASQRHRHGRAQPHHRSAPGNQRG